MNGHRRTLNPPSGALHVVKFLDAGRQVSKRGCSTTNKGEASCVYGSKSIVTRAFARKVGLSNGGITP